MNCVVLFIVCVDCVVLRIVCVDCVVLCIVRVDCVVLCIVCVDCVVLCIVCVQMSTVLLPPSVNPIAVNKYTEYSLWQTLPAEIQISVLYLIQSKGKLCILTLPF